jgi:ABC-type transport system involved in cytochrome bd biosynthesis fused ATPase/permease subunit
MLIISHKDSLTQIADRIYVLDKGASIPIPRTPAHSAAN